VLIAVRFSAKSASETARWKTMFAMMTNITTIKKQTTVKQTATPKESLFFSFSYVFARHSHEQNAKIQ
jgi:hypothetical protein